MPKLKVQLVRWGNSHAVRLPKSVLEKARVKPGDELEVEVKDGRIALQPAVRELRLRHLVARITPANLHGEIDWGKAEGREVW